MPWGAIVVGVIALVALVALIVVNRKYGSVKAEKKAAEASLEGRERFDHAAEEHEASGGLAGAAGRRVRDDAGGTSS